MTQRSYVTGLRTLVHLLFNIIGTIQKRQGRHFPREISHCKQQHRPLWRQGGRSGTDGAGGGGWAERMSCFYIHKSTVFCYPFLKLIIEERKTKITLGRSKKTKLDSSQRA